MVQFNYLLKINTLIIIRYISHKLLTQSSACMLQNQKLLLWPEVRLCVLFPHFILREHGGLVVECQTPGEISQWFKTYLRCVETLTMRLKAPQSTG